MAFHQGHTGTGGVSRQGEALPMTDMARFLNFRRAFRMEMASAIDRASLKP